MGDFYYTEPFPLSPLSNVTFGRERKVDIVEFGDTDVNQIKDARWPFDRTSVNVSLVLKDAAEWETFLKWWNALGPQTGFLIKNHSDWKSCDLATSEAVGDQVLGAGDGTDTTFQLIKTHTLGSYSNSKTILTPIPDSVKVGIRNSSSGDIECGSAASPIQWSVNTQTGLVTFDADITASISAISKAANAQIDFTGAHGLSNGETVYISGVSGMTEINGLRGTVTVVDSDSITVDINSTAFTTYTSGGTVNTLPQTGESVISGFQFYTPVRFDIEELPNIGWLFNNRFSVQNIPLVELFNL